jgi:GNAT superfamily N-acetyltransferase
MDRYRFSVHTCETQQEMEATQNGLLTIVDGLGRNILKVLGDVELGRSIRVFLEDSQDAVVGGAVGDVFGGWICISLCWVQESLRNQGYGAQLMDLLEHEARQLGCKHAHVDTYSFEARPFYEKLGYELFATLEDYPEGYCKYFLKKTLDTDKKRRR